MATDAAGNLIACGYFNGTIDLGGGPMTSAGGVDIYVAKFSPTGTLLWSKRFGDSANQGTRGLAVDASGNLLITGSFVGTVNFGGATLTSAGGADVYVVKLDPNGNHIWSKRFGDTLNQVGAGIATDAAGDVYFTGYLYGAMDFGGGTLTSVSGVDTYLVKLDPAGNHLWSMRGGGVGDQAAVRVAVDPVGNVSFVGIAVGTGSYGGPRSPRPARPTSSSPSTTPLVITCGVNCSAIRPRRGEGARVRLPRQPGDHGAPLRSHRFWRRPDHRGWRRRYLHCQAGTLISKRPAHASAGRRRQS